VFLDSKSGAERRRFKEAAYPGISYASYVKSTAGGERK
jgi:hypothetical protein